MTKAISKNRNLLIALFFVVCAALIGVIAITSRPRTASAATITQAGLQTVSMTGLTSGTSNYLSIEIDFEKIPGFVALDDFGKVSINIYIYSYDPILENEINVWDERFSAVKENVNNLPAPGINMTEIWQNNEDVTCFFDCSDFISGSLSGFYRNQVIDFTIQISSSVSYNGNAYTETTGSIVFSRHGEKQLPPVQLPPDPEKNGYDFDGWYYDEDLTDPYAGEPIYEDTVLYAKFTPITYKITYSLNGGTNDAGNPASYTIESAAITLKNPTRTGYTFKGWTEGSSIPAGSTGAKTFTATWQVTTYAITYVLNGGTNGTGNPASYTVESSAITLKDPTKKGYTFKGWTEGNSIPAGSTGAKTFTAKWEIITYTITYVLNGGVNDPTNPETYTVETPTITLKDPSRTGYNFNSWVQGNQIVKGSVGDLTFTAAFDPIRVTVTFIVDGKTYEAIEMDYGSTLAEVAEAAGLDAAYYTFETDEHEILTAGDIVLSGEVIATELPTSQKVKTWLTQYWWLPVSIIGGVIILVISLALIFRRRGGFR